MSTLDDLLIDPESALRVPVGNVAALLTEVVNRAGRLELLKTFLSVRLRNDDDKGIRSSKREADITQDEAARRSGIPLRTIRWLTRTGRLPSFRRGRNRMVRMSDLDLLIETARGQGVALQKLPHVASGIRGSRGGQDRAPKTPTDASRVRRTGRRRTEHGRALGSGNANRRDYRRDPDSPPRSAGAQTAPKEEVTPCR